MSSSNSRPSISSRNYLSVPAGDYPCGDNLYLVVAPTGGRRWLFRFQRSGVKDSMGFGSARDVSFNDAKDKAVDARRLLAKGINPKESRDAQRRAQACPLFAPYVTAWRDTYEKSLKHRASRNKLKRNTDVHCAPLHKMRVDEITTDHVIKLVLDPIRHQVENVRDVRQRLKLIFDAAIADGHRKDNPADYDTKLRPKLGKAPKRGRVRGHHKGLSHRDLPAFMLKLAASSDQSARGLEILAMTAARTAEIRHMKWNQIDFQNAVWHLRAADIPEETGGGDGEGTKNEYDKLTPLPRQALSILQKLYEARVSDHVFPSRDLTGPISNNTLLKKLKEVSGDPTLTVHGLRGTFRTWAQDETEFEEEIVEHCMHHITGDDAEKAYKHGSAINRRRKVLQAWADFALN
ncbi:integrase arm-type DNA-binding domain-containing protein [Bradyrhizobium tropiciagri]|uniref:tyrosine-type recombinase/integrase n=1 Tax=Bradyrhizobium tropiciagri TaxID=312253 RepID=UPI001BAA5521|nr:integrase arm-type DNA-binding domain-containing protein [Bradyrhizobium tropiciagri]MBR0900987.1 integrase arm-type DNA-binding domain-containing protein [Bradyrhizobium tropiciagri]